MSQQERTALKELAVNLQGYVSVRGGGMGAIGGAAREMCDALPCGSMWANSHGNSNPSNRDEPRAVCTKEVCGREHSKQARWRWPKQMECRDLLLPLRTHDKRTHDKQATAQDAKDQCDAREFACPTRDAAVFLEWARVQSVEARMHQMGAREARDVSTARGSASAWGGGAAVRPFTRPPPREPPRRQAYGRSPRTVAESSERACNCAAAGTPPPRVLIT